MKIVWRCAAFGPVAGDQLFLATFAGGMHSAAGLLVREHVLLFRTEALLATVSQPVWVGRSARLLARSPACLTAGWGWIWLKRKGVTFRAEMDLARLLWHTINQSDTLLLTWKIIMPNYVIRAVSVPIANSQLVTSERTAFSDCYDYYDYLTGRHHALSAT